MMILQDLLPILYLRSLEDAINRFSGAVFEKMSTSLSDTSCNSSSGSESEACRDDATALTLKLVAMACILLAGVVGVGLPLVGKNRRLLRTDGNLFFAAKAFAAGVILATGFVHMLPGATSDLTDSCLPEYPWLKFPFAGFIAMTSALATLVVDFLGTQYYENKKRKEDEDNAGRAVTIESGLSSTSTKAFLAKEGGVILHAHSQAAQHNHGQDEHEGHVASHSHVHGGNNDEVDSGIRHVVVSQVLELGIVSHSVIIGLSLGVSQSPCTIRPLMAALSFHQFFEGFALGGCISQAQFTTLSTTIMACFFSITTPAGIGLGICVSSFYNGNSPRALIMEGTLDAISAGILVYMALVDLIAADFLSNRMSGNVRLQLMSYFALFLGAGLMSMLAIWA